MSATEDVASGSVAAVTAEASAAEVSKMERSSGERDGSSSGRVSVWSLLGARVRGVGGAGAGEVHSFLAGGSSRASGRCWVLLLLVGVFEPRPSSGWPLAGFAFSERETAGELALASRGARARRLVGVDAMAITGQRSGQVRLDEAEGG